MFKKIVAVVLVIALTAAASIAGTMAYLQDSDSDVNVMTLGNVSIAQHEYQRADGIAYNATASKDANTLVPFEQGQGLYPAVPKNNAATDYSAEQTDLFKWGDYVYSGTAANGLWNDDKLSNVMDKFVFVENTGKSDAYVRTIIAFECPEGMEYSQGSDKEFMMNVNGSKTAYSWDKTVGYITVDNTRYLVAVATYLKVLEPGNTGHPSLLQVVMTHNATNEDMEKLGDTYEILTLSQAVQAKGFEELGADYALNAAFDDVTVDTATEWFGGVKASGSNNEFETNENPENSVNGTDKAAVLTAIEKAQPGDTIALTEDTTIAGYNAGEKLVIEKDITLDLNGHTLTTESGWGGIDLKGGASIKNGTINHTGNTAAIKAFQVESIENVVINVTETAGKTKGGIVVQEGAGCYVNSIKNVVINGATNGIECYRSTNENAIGSMENVTINATQNGIYLNGAGKIGSISNCKIEGGNIGINAYLANLWNISLNIYNSEISGGVSGIDIWDEAATNTDSTVTFNYDGSSIFAGSTNNIKVTLQKEITCTINGEAQSTPCDIRK